MVSGRDDCQRIEREVEMRPKESTVACTRQVDTGTFLINVAYQQKESAFFLTAEQYQRPGWDESLWEQIAAWLASEGL
jgi:hypothetical protein